MDTSIYFNHLCPTFDFQAFYKPLIAVVMKDRDGFQVQWRGGGQREVTSCTLVRVAGQDAHGLPTGWVKSRTDGEPHRDRETHHESTESPLEDPRQGSKVVFLFNPDIPW